MASNQVCCSFCWKVKLRRKIKGSWFEEGKAFDMNARETDHKLDQGRKLE